MNWDIKRNDLTCQDIYQSFLWFYLLSFYYPFLCVDGSFLFYNINLQRKAPSISAGVAPVYYPSFRCAFLIVELTFWYLCVLTFVVTVSNRYTLKIAGKLRRGNPRQVTRFIFWLKTAKNKNPFVFGDALGILYGTGTIF